MDGVAGKLSISLLEYGVLGVVVLLLIVAVVFLFRQNQSLYMDNAAIHEKRVEDAKRFAAEAAAAVSKMEATVKNLQELVDTIKELAAGNK